MITVDVPGYTFLRKNLIFIKSFIISRILLKGNLIRRLFLCKPIGGEYEKLNNFFQQIGIAHHVSCPHAHQQNGLVERKYRHIVEVGPTLLANASMPLKFCKCIYASKILG
jgi:hypothetical protein